MENKLKIQKSYKNESSAKLYLVPTPIGNLEDMSFRAIKTLENVDLIASEDTRNTQKLLNHFEIKTKQISLHEHNYKEKIPQIIEKLEQGLSIAQVSDAGMPSISDPGHELVLECINLGIDVISLPGATAGVIALIASGITPQPFLFYGFLPRKKAEIKKALEPYLNIEASLIFYESPYRIKKTIENLIAIFPNETKFCLARELTKLHEEYLRGTGSEILAYIEENGIKGEICLIVENKGNNVKEENNNLNLTLKEQVEKIIEEENLSSKEAIKKVAKNNNLKKQVVYQEYHGI